MPLTPPSALVSGERHFRWRGGDVSRIEALSDIVFALVLTLVILAEVPHTLDQLSESIWHLPSIVICWAILLWFWNLHYLFHRRYGFEDVFTMGWNSVLLCLILIYAYPLKFLFLMLTYHLGNTMGLALPDVAIEILNSGNGTQSSNLMLFYCASFGLIFSLFALLNWHALRRASELGLNEIELHLTRASMGANRVCVALSVAAIALVLLVPMGIPLAGMSFGLLGPLLWMQGMRAERGLQALLEKNHS
ncbi:MAG TPA: DUF1211 domain-containing protein [Planctomycetes bacterium]|nr:DUF1211 domain-containing protein [Planctomycetota bacterium]